MEYLYDYFVMIKKNPPCINIYPEINTYTYNAIKEHQAKNRVSV